jgi:hypothetical protein
MQTESKMSKDEESKTGKDVSKYMGSEPDV